MSHMFSKDDLKLSGEEFVNFAPIAIFCALVAPFLIASYTVGFLMDVTGWSDATDDTLGEY